MIHLLTTVHSYMTIPKRLKMNDITVRNKHSFYTTALKVKHDVIVIKNVRYRMQDMNHYTSTIQSDDFPRLNVFDV